MAVEITTEDSAQDEVCVELWDILQVAKRTAIALINDDESFETRTKHVIEDLIYLVSRAGTSYRYHAEHPRIALVPTNHKELGI